MSRLVVADESVDGPVVEALRRGGIEVVYVAEQEPGLSDDDVLHLANVRDAVLVTADTDFGALVFRKQQSHAGVVLLRLAGLAASQKADLAVQVFAAHGAEMRGAFTVVTPRQVRIRRLK